MALELALSIHRLWAGPWIQHKLDPEAIQLLYKEEPTSVEDFTSVCIPCNLIHNFQVTEDIWREPQVKRDTRQTSSDFLLSFAQLLVDIAPRKGRKPLQCEGRHTYLLEEAKSMIRDPLLEWYGAAVLACVQFTLDYKLAKDLGGGENPTAIARGVILKNIVLNLRKHFHLWKNQVDHQKSVHHDARNEVADTLQEHVSPRNNVLKISYRKPHPSIFTLFAPGDETYQVM